MTTATENSGSSSSSESSSIDDHGTQDPPGTGSGSSGTESAVADLEAEVKKWKELAQKHEGRAKENNKAAKELEELRQKSMSEQEKAVADAKKAGYAEGLAAGASKVAAAELRAAAAGRMSDEQVEALLEGANLSAFIGEDGEVDRTRLGKFVDGIAPKANEDEGADAGTARFPDLGQGARGGQTGPGSKSPADPLERDLRAKLGIR